MIEGSCKIIRSDITAYLSENLRIRSQPGKHQFLRYFVSVLLFLIPVQTRFWFDSLCHSHALHRQPVHHLSEFFRLDLISSGNGFDITASFNLVFKTQQPLCRFFKKVRATLRVLHIILPFQCLQFKHKTVRSVIQPLLKGFFSHIFDKFIRILVRPEIDDLRGKSGGF